jgi:hypothetical protein
MLKIIISFLFSILVAKFFLSVFGENSIVTGWWVKEDAAYIVTAPAGVIGCLSKAKYYEAADFYAKKNMAEITKLLEDETCFFFKKGEVLSAPKDTCLKDDADNELRPFMPKKFILIKPYLPCFAVR